MPSCFLLAGMQRSWQEAKQPSWIVRKPHVEHGSKEPGSPDHVEKAPCPTWSAYLDCFWERKLLSRNKPERTFCIFFHTELNPGQTDPLILSPFRDEGESLPSHSQCKPGFKHTWFLTSGFQPSPRLPWEVHRICTEVGRRPCIFLTDNPRFPMVARII